MIEAKTEISEQVLNRRDSFGIWNIEKLEINIEKNSKILSLELPKTIN